MPPRSARLRHGRPLGFAASGLPLKDNIPTVRFPIVTVAVIAINLIVFIWQLNFPTDNRLDQAGFGAIDQSALEYGAIPDRITNPGEDLDRAVAVESAGQLQAEVVCPGSEEFREAEAAGSSIPAWRRSRSTRLVVGDAVHVDVHARRIPHIAGNMLFLWVFGNNIED